MALSKLIPLTMISLILILCGASHCYAFISPKGYEQSAEVNDFKTDSSLKNFNRIPSNYRNYALAEILVYPEYTDEEKKILSQFLHNLSPSDQSPVYTSAFLLAIEEHEREKTYDMFDMAAKANKGNAAKLICLAFNNITATATEKISLKEAFEQQSETVYTLASITYNVRGLSRELCQFNNQGTSTILSIDNMIRMAAPDIARDFSSLRQTWKTSEVKTTFSESICTSEQLEFHIWSSIKNFTDSKKKQLNLILVQDGSCRLQGQISKLNGLYSFEMKNSRTLSKILIQFKDIKEATRLILETQRATY